MVSTYTIWSLLTLYGMYGLVSINGRPPPYGICLHNMGCADGINKRATSTKWALRGERAEFINYVDFDNKLSININILFLT